MTPEHRRHQGLAARRRRRHTPLVRLSRLGAGLTPQLVAKVEYLNPGGSIKDRPAIAMIEAAEREGLLKPGGTIVEPTSGNTGTGLAIAARLKGYRVIAVMPDKMSREKIDLLRAYGAEVVVAPTAVAPDSPESYYRVADRLTEEIPGAFQPNQYFNPANPASHYASTGPGAVGAERRRDHAPRRRRRHRRHDHRRRALPQGAQPGDPGDRRRPGRLDLLAGRGGREALPRRGRRRGLLARDVRPARSSTATSRSPTRSRSSRRGAWRWSEGILAGGSCGTAMHAALVVAAELTDPEAMVCVILPDGGRSYLSKIFNDAWMTQHGFLERTGVQTVGDVLRRKQEGERDPAARQRPRARPREGRDRAAARAPRLAAAGRQRAGRARASSARSASAGCCAARSTTRRCCSRRSSTSWRRRSPRSPSTTRCARRRELLSGERQALMVTEHGRPGRHRHAHRPARGAGPVSAHELPDDARFATRAVHAGLEPDPHFRSVIPAIHQTSTFAQPAPGEYLEEYDYARTANPTRRALEDALGHARGRPRDGVRLRPRRRARADHRGLLGRRPRRPAVRPLRRHLPARRQDPHALGPDVHDGRPDRPRRARRGRHAADADRLGRDADEPAARRHRHRGRHRAQRATRSSSSTTRSPRR